MVSTSTPKPKGSSRSSRSRTPSRIPTPAIKKSKYLSSTSKSNRSRTPTRSIIMTSTPMMTKQKKSKPSSSSKKEWKTKTPNKKTEFDDFVVGSAKKKSVKKSHGKKRKSIVVADDVYDDDLDIDNVMDDYRPKKTPSRKKTSQKKSPSRNKSTGKKSIVSPIIEFDDDDNDVYEEHLYEVHDSNTGLSSPSSLVRRSKRIRHHHPQQQLNSIIEEQSIEFKSLSNNKNDTNQSINGQKETQSSNNNLVTDKWNWFGCSIM